MDGPCRRLQRVARSLSALRKQGGSGIKKKNRLPRCRKTIFPLALLARDHSIRQPVQSSCIVKSILLTDVRRETGVYAEPRWPLHVSASNPFAALCGHSGLGIPAEGGHNWSRNNNNSTIRPSLRLPQFGLQALSSTDGGLFLG